MRIVDPNTGKSYVEKRRQRYAEPGQPRELTFSCYRRFPFFSRPRVREWFRVALERARRQFGVQVWAYVIMPEHIHLLVYPGDTPEQIPPFLQRIKGPVGRAAVDYLRVHAPQWLERLAVREGRRVRHRFWQPGGGYDRNVICAHSLRAMIDYIHLNPVRRGLVAQPEDYEWSSVRWFLGLRPVPIEMDEQIRIELGRD